MNTPQYLERVKNLVLENLRYVGGPPSVQMSGKNLFRCRSRILPIAENIRLDIPSLPIDDIIDDPNKDEDLIPPNERRPMRLLDSRRQGDGELSDSDDEGEGGRRHHASHHDHEESPSRSASATRDVDEDDGGGRKFGMGVGIMSSGQTASTHGAGPSGHTTVPPIMAKPASVPSSPGSSAAMEVDDGRTDSAPAIPTPTKEKSMEPERVVNGTVIGPPANPPPAAMEAS